MYKKPTWWQMMKVKISMGRPLAPVLDLGEVNHTIIRYKDVLLSVMEGEEGIVSLSWYQPPMMPPDVPIREFWTSSPPKSVVKSPKKGKK